MQRGLQEAMVVPRRQLLFRSQVKFRICIVSFAPPGLGVVVLNNYPRLAPWAAFFRRFAAAASGRLAVLSADMELGGNWRGLRG